MSTCTRRTGPRVRGRPSCRRFGPKYGPCPLSSFHGIRLFFSFHLRGARVAACNITIRIKSYGEMLCQGPSSSVGGNCDPSPTLLLICVVVDLESRMPLAADHLNQRRAAPWASASYIPARRPAKL
jgi:hypothetical protein